MSIDGKKGIQGQVVVGDKVVASTPSARITRKQARDVQIVARAAGYRDWPLSKTF